MSALRDREHETLHLMRTALAEGRFGKTAIVSSFGAESAVLLDFVRRVASDAPVIFVDTRMLFQETLDYKNTLIRYLGLTNVRTISPDGSAIRNNDAWGRLHLSQPDACCDLRKTSVLDLALEGFDAWITGRKRFQASTRSTLSTVEYGIKGKTKINPLADWLPHQLAEYAAEFDLPQHPLIDHGYASIGCATCTSAVQPGEDARAGRWRGSNKTECGIHFVDGKIVRPGASANV